jgi:hypothetical protein
LRLTFNQYLCGAAETTGNGLIQLLLNQLLNQIDNLLIGSGTGNNRKIVSLAPMFKFCCNQVLSRISHHDSYQEATSLAIPTFRRLLQEKQSVILPDWLKAL